MQMAWQSAFVVALEGSLLKAVTQPERWGETFEHCDEQASGIVGMVIWAETTVKCVNV